MFFLPIDHKRIRGFPTQTLPVRPEDEDPIYGIEQGEQEVSDEGLPTAQRACINMH